MRGGGCMPGEVTACVPSGVACPGGWGGGVSA